MDKYSVDKLKINRDLIIKDLHGDVIDSLHKKGIINLQEYKDINCLKAQRERNEKFLEVLFNKNNGLQEFMEALKVWYWWIEEKLQEPSKIKQDPFLEVTSNVPPIPLRNVSRSSLSETLITNIFGPNKHCLQKNDYHVSTDLALNWLTEVRTRLKQLKKSHYVVLHGMSGSGKSSLAAEALDHNILLEQFQGKVHWLSCGQDTKRDENGILGLLIQLNERICDEELMSDVKTANVKTLNIKLQKRFQTSDFKEGLIVLDDVNSPHVIEALNIGCKTLVTTNDFEVMKKYESRCHAVKVNEGFTEEESMKQLALSVGMKVEVLPPYARQIHLHGKGHPLIMSLIGAQLQAHQEEARINADSWKPYLDVLVNKQYGNLNRRSYGGISFLPTTIELCINNLSPEMREKYQDFAVFVEDVNIKTEVLEILWNMSTFGVKLIMEEFCTKSLIVRKYNPNQICYVYGIHDLLLYYLKKQLNEEALKDLHVKLITRYQEVCNGDVAHLPKNDNYFLYYIGYHIFNSKLYNLFPEWYFNLDFIEAKLRVAGAGDLILDYKRYSSHFTDGCFDSAAVTRKLVDFVRFVEAAGLHIRRNHGPDIVQFALQEPHDSEVYKTAMRLAQSRPNSTYLRFQLGPPKSRSAPHVIPTKDQVSAACFTKDNNVIMVAFESGTIQIINRKGYATRDYKEHTERVTRLSVSLDRDIFLSVSNNCVKVWKLPDLDCSISSGSGDRTPSPSQRQIDFTDIFNHKSVDKQGSWLTMTKPALVNWASFSTDGLKMALCCSAHNLVEVWEMSNQHPLLNRIRAKGTSCIFSHNNELLIIGGFSNSTICIHDIVNNTPVNQLVISYSILALFNLPESDVEMKFGALTKATLCVWALEDTTIQPAEQNTIPCLRDYNKGEYEEYVFCAAAPDGSVVAVATSSGKILICDLTDGSLLREMNDSSGNIKYLAIDESKEHMLLACYDDDTIKLWSLGEVHSGKPATMKTNFVVTWTDNQALLILAAPTYKSCVKKVFGKSKSEEDLQIPVSSEINICGISKCGKYIAISTSSGEVFLHSDDIELEVPKIMTVKKYVVKLKVEILQKRIFVIVGLDRICMVWKCEKGDNLRLEEAEIFTFTLNDRLVDYFILPSEIKLLTISQNGSIKKWSLMTGDKLDVVCQPRLDVMVCDTDLSCSNVSVTLDSRRMLLNVYNLEGKREEMKIKLHSTPSCCSFSRNGKNLAIGFENGIIEVYDIDTPTEAFKKEITNLEEPIKCICVSSTGLVGAATKTRVVLATSEGRVGQARLQVQRLVMSPDDTTVITVDSDGHMHLIDNFRITAHNSFGNLPNSIDNLSTKNEHLSRLRKRPENSS